MRLTDHHALIGSLICAIVWVACAIDPWDFQVWLLEQVATLCALLVLAWCLWRRIHFSIPARIGIVAFFVAHTIGTHFTYSLTPYDQFIQQLTGLSLNELAGWQRNHYDRFVHLMFGICMAFPVAEVLMQRLRLGACTARFLAVHFVISTSAIYELAEWAAALLFGEDLGALYLGTQGDVWDAHADIALAGLGQLAVYALHAALTMRNSPVPS